MPESVTQTRVIAPPPCRAAIIHDDRSFQPSTFINRSEQSDQQPEWAMPRKRTLKSHSVNSRCQPNYDIHARCSETSAVRRRVPERCHSVSGGCSFVCCGQHQGQRSAGSGRCKTANCGRPSRDTRPKPAVWAIVNAAARCPESGPMLSSPSCEPRNECLPDQLGQGASEKTQKRVQQDRS